jgi:hypothetical protein
LATSLAAVLLRRPAEPIVRSKGQWVFDAILKRGEDNQSSDARSSEGRGMSPILTAEDVVKRIAAECAFVDERGAVGIRLKPAAAIVRSMGSNLRHGDQTRGAGCQSPLPSSDRSWRKLDNHVIDNIVVRYWRISFSR